MTEHTLTIIPALSGLTNPYGECACGARFFEQDGHDLTGRHAEHVQREADWDLIAPLVTRAEYLDNTDRDEFLAALARLRGNR